MRDLLLIFAYHFPPENAIGGVRPFRFAKYLSRLGVRTHTFTAADVSTRPDLDAETVLDPFLTRQPASAGWQLERAIRKFVLPGATGTQWARRAYQAACKYIDAQRDQPRITILATFPPIGTPFAAYWLAKNLRLPWILDLRDPIGEQPGVASANSFPGKAFQFAERTLVSNADGVIANTDSAQARLGRLFPAKAGSIELIWNGFDPETRLGPLPITERTRRVYRHVGELYEGRVITPLLLSLDRLIRSGKIAPESILIHQLGPVRSTSVPSREFMADAQTLGWLKITAEQVPQAEAQRLMQEADGLILVQPHTKLQVPGKLFEYVQIGRPVLAYVPTDTPIERILKLSNTPHVCGYASNSETAFDESVARFFHLDSRAAEPSEWFESNFNVQHHAAQLFRLIQRLHA